MKRRFSKKMKSRRTFYKTSRRVHPKNEVPRGGYRL